MVRAAVVVWSMHAILFGLGTDRIREINAAWTTAQTVATFVLVSLTWRLLREPASAAEPSPLQRPVTA